MKQAQQFAIAKSSNGTIGLITSKTAVEHTYPERTVTAWTGVILARNSFADRNDPEKEIVAEAGGFWSSSNPEVIGYADPEMIAALVETA